MTITIAMRNRLRLLLLLYIATTLFLTQTGGWTDRRKDRQTERQTNDVDNYDDGDDGDDDDDDDDDDADADDADDDGRACGTYFLFLGSGLKGSTFKLKSMQSLFQKFFEPILPYKCEFSRCSLLYINDVWLIEAYARRCNTLSSYAAGWQSAGLIDKH
uniref:Uncharacterized protein n=1 Tax=Glossina brevipalpis TaxID=37001 RepID=A0A1A9WYI2_9MUSC